MRMNKRQLVLGLVFILISITLFANTSKLRISKDSVIGFHYDITHGKLNPNEYINTIFPKINSGIKDSRYIKLRQLDKDYVYCTIEDGEMDMMRFISGDSDAQKFLKILS